MKKIVLTTLGSLGDLHPVMGLANELQKQGHQAIICSSACYQSYVEDAGLQFHAIRPNLQLSDKKLIQAVLDPKNGPEILHKNFIFPELENSLNDLLPVAKDCDLIVSSVLSYFVPLVAHLVQRPWVMALLSPISMWSGHSPPILAPLPFLGKMQFLGPSFHRFILKQLFKISEPWAQPLKELRKKVGLQEGGNPFWEGLFSENLVLCLWSQYFYAAKMDWPVQAQTTGFIFYDPIKDIKTQLDLNSFLKRDNRSVVTFTLGSTSIEDSENLLQIFFKIAQQQNKNLKSIITVGKTQFEKYKKLSTQDIYVIDYLPYQSLFSLSDLIIHQGGVGTVAQSFFAGKPQIILPSCNDQFDNAYRVYQLGLGTFLEKKKVNIRALSKLILDTFANINIKKKCQEICNQVQIENGTQKATQLILDQIQEK